MAAAGWFPDPAGQPGQQRYWDGQRWTDQLRPAQPEKAAGPTRLVWLWAALALVVVVALLWVFLNPPGFVAGPGSTDSATPTISAWNETASPTPPPSASPSDTGPSGGTDVNCPTGGDDADQNDPARIHGGGISFAKIPGWRDYHYSSFPWLHSRAGQVDSVTTGWIALAVAGQALKADGFGSVRRAAEATMDCELSGQYYDKLARRVNLFSKAITVAGRPAWHVRARAEATPDAPVTGDFVDVIAVDTGSPVGYGVFTSQAPLEDPTRQQLVQAAAASITVD